MLIVNADDFGMTAGINAGILTAHRQGIVTSASLMVRQPFAAEAAALSENEPGLGLGLHVDLVEWEPSDGVWQEMYARVDLEDSVQVADELAMQIQLFCSLVGRPPDHLDSHQHVHLNGPPRSECLKVAKAYGIPLRGIDPRVGFCGQFYGQQGRGVPYPEGITTSNLVRLIEEAPAGWMELTCHPGYADDVRSVYAAEREQELAVLCDPSLPKILYSMGVRLGSFAEL